MENYIMSLTNEEFIGFLFMVWFLGGTIISGIGYIIYTKIKSIFMKSRKVRA